MMISRDSWISASQATAEVSLIFLLFSFFAEWIAGILLIDRRLSPEYSMGKKGGWLTTMKKVFKSSSKEQPEKKKANANKWQHPDAPEIMSLEHFPGEIPPDVTNGESASESPAVDDQKHAFAVAVATAAAAEAAVAAAQAAAKVVRLAGYRRQSEEERAAVCIQSHYRGYLV